MDGNAVERRHVVDRGRTQAKAASALMAAASTARKNQTLLRLAALLRTNAGDAQIDGFEMSYRQSLTFLPSWARGLQAFVNFTKLNLSGSNTADFSGYNPKSLGGGINFVRGRLALKTTISYLGDTRTGAVAASATVPVDTFNYQAKRMRIGVNATYNQITFSI
jgi:hypothetical protein